MKNLLIKIQNIEEQISNLEKEKRKTIKEVLELSKFKKGNRVIFKNSNIIGYVNDILFTPKSKYSLFHYTLFAEKKDGSVSSISIASGSSIEEDILELKEKTIKELEIEKQNTLIKENKKPQNQSKKFFILTMVEKWNTSLLIVKNKLEKN